MLYGFAERLESVNDIVWGTPLIALIIGTGILLTVRLGAPQFRRFGGAVHYMAANESGGDGEVSSFGALCTALAASSGTGSIVGVAAAISTGGPGALFWMVAAACVGMAVKYAEGLLAVKYREIEFDGHAIGGPFYYIERGMGGGFKWLAKIFAFFGAFAALFGMAQSNGVASAVSGLFGPSGDNTFSILGGDYSESAVITAVLASLVTALVVTGGVRRVAGFSMVVIPAAAFAYAVCCVLIIAYNSSELPGAFADIFAGAFGLRAATGGAIGAALASVRAGARQGVFSNGAGLGGSPIAAAAARTSEPARLGLVLMIVPFIDTVVLCGLTGLAILVTHSWGIGLEGARVTMNAFSTGFVWGPSIGALILTIGLVIFTFMTILGWNYYGERCLEYLAGGAGTLSAVYRFLYIIAVLAGPFIPLNTVWAIAHILNGLMAVPNLLALLALSGVAVAETRSFTYKSRR